MVRCFKNEKILHVNNKVDPISDFKTIYLELLLADIQLLEKREEKLLKLTKVGNPSDLSQQKVITELIETLSNENEICIDDYSESEKSFIDSLNFDIKHKSISASLPSEIIILSSAKSSCSLHHAGSSENTSILSVLSNFFNACS